ncbi:DUF397 domain-containing protein [Nocardiopsis deserti]|uniref:DUF397 domain-containing protein n=1 Tax=Nocardiopsis deserti TaxID=2605988 RepID=UPI00123C37B5|nr:DUF397 domain-containing protein [Nocardiopsis deserti]
MTIQLEFRKSSYSAQGQECVEVAHFPDNFRDSNDCGAAIRDSKHPDAGHLPFPATEWSGFLSAALSR